MCYGAWELCGVVIVKGNVRCVDGGYVEVVVSCVIVVWCMYDGNVRKVCGDLVGGVVG